MTRMSMGSNIALPAARLRASLRWSAGPAVPEVDASALLLGPAGEVTAEADFVFFNQPDHPSGAVRMAGRTPAPAASDSLDVDLTKVPADIARIVLAASSDGGTFGQVPDLALELTDVGTGRVIASFPMQAGAETAFVSAEIYRRNEQWKFRAVGQGYSSGLAGLAADFGIDATGGESSTPAPPAERPPVTTQPTPTQPAQSQPTQSQPTPTQPPTTQPTAPAPATTGPARTSGSSLLDLDAPVNL